jgi:ubiquinone/menaquinone biosynthesis C-methylase UbiE
MELRKKGRETRVRFPSPAPLLEAHKMSLYSRSEISVTQNVTFRSLLWFQSNDCLNSDLKTNSAVMSSESANHKDEIISQFTSQSVPFAELQEHREERSLEIFQELGRFNGSERVLDSGCGPGLVSCYLAPLVKKITGVDLTPAMVELAKASAEKRGLSNAHFQLGDMGSLPFEDDNFDVSVTRYTFHHLENPTSAFSEMLRVTKSGGKLIVVDVSPDVSKQDAYNTFEIQRDSSHTKALTKDELCQIGSGAGLGEPEIVTFGLSMKAESLINASFPKTVTREYLIKLLSDDVGTNQLCFNARMDDGVLMMTFPMTALCWTI